MRRELSVWYMLRGVVCRLCLALTFHAASFAMADVARAADYPAANKKKEEKGDEIGRTIICNIKQASNKGQNGIFIGRFFDGLSAMIKFNPLYDKSD